MSQCQTTFGGVPEKDLGLLASAHYSRFAARGALRGVTAAISRALDEQLRVVQLALG